LATLRSSQSRLDPRDRTRFNYTWANNFSKRCETGIMPGLTPVLNLVSTAIQCESDREHENSWNEDIHRTLINMAAGTSRYAQCLAVKSLYVPTKISMLCWTLDQDADIALCPERPRL